jgi:hypothetical protein
LWIPSTAPPAVGYPALLLLHGRGESQDPELAVRAWFDRYGLGTSYERLLQAPVSLTPQQRPFMTPRQLEGINTSLAHKPFSNLALICPHTPNPHLSAAPARCLDDYARWVEQRLLPAARQHCPLSPNGPIGIDGCSMGGHVAIEVFTRIPHAFRSFGVTQPAFGEFRVKGYAQLIARAAQTDNAVGIHLQTSTRDPYRKAVTQLSQRLQSSETPHTLRVLPGPHGQPWLRASGTLTLLWWHHLTLTRGADPSVSSARSITANGL